MNYFVTANLLGSANHRQIKKQNKKFLDALLASIEGTKEVKNEQNYNALLEELVTLAKTHHVDDATTLLFHTELDPIQKSKPLTEKTVWGGVSLKKVDVEKNLIKKLLVIKQYGVLGFEIHQQKHEKLQVLEGRCLVLYSNHKHPQWKEGKVTISIGTPGSRFVFEPGDEHGIIALTDCVIRETSTNHLDDLVYIFPNHQVTI